MKQKGNIAMIAEKIKNALENMHSMNAKELSEYDAFIQSHIDKPLSDYSAEDKQAMQQSMPLLLELLKKQVKELRDKVEEVDERTNRKAA